MDDIPILDPSLSLIRFSARKLQSISCLSNAQQNVAATLCLQITLRPLSTCTTHWLSVKHCFAHAPCKHYKTPYPEIHRIWPLHAHRHRSITSCIIHEATEKFYEGRWSRKHTINLYKSKSSWLPGNFHAAAPNWTPPKSHCRSSRQESCLRLRAWIALNSLDNLDLQRSNSALVHSEAQNTPQFFEGCC